MRADSCLDPGGCRITGLAGTRAVKRPGCVSTNCGREKQHIRAALQRLDPVKWVLGEESGDGGPANGIGRMRSTGSSGVRDVGVE